MLIVVTFEVILITLASVSAVFSIDTPPPFFPPLANGASVSVQKNVNAETLTSQPGTKLHSSLSSDFGWNTVGNSTNFLNSVTNTSSSDELDEGEEYELTDSDYADKREDDEESSTEDEDESNSIEDEIATNMKNPLNFQNLLGADFQPGRLANIFFGLIIMMTMMIFQGYAMWVFGIAFLPGTRSLTSNWTLDMNSCLSLLEVIVDVLEFVQKTSDDNQVK